MSIKGKRSRTEGRVSKIVDRRIYSNQTLATNKLKPGQLTYVPGDGWYYMDDDGNLVQLIGGVGGIIDGGTY